MEGGQAAVPVAAAGPGRTTSRRVEAPISDPCTTGVEGAGGTGGHGQASRRGAERSEAASPRGRPDQARPLAATSLARLEADAGPAGPGRASSRRAERSSLRGRRAGGQAARRPEICQGNKQQAERPPPTSTRSGRARRTARAAPGTPATPHTTPTQPPRYAKGAGTEVPAPCRLTQPLPRRGLRPDDRQSWRRRRIHRNMPPTTAAPRPAPPIRPSKPVRARRWARPVLGLVAGTSGAT